MGEVIVIHYPIVLELERKDNAVGNLDSRVCMFLAV